MCVCGFMLLHMCRPPSICLLLIRSFTPYVVVALSFCARLETPIETQMASFSKVFPARKEARKQEEKETSANKKKHEDEELLDEDNLEKLLKLLLTFVAIK